MIIRQWLGAPDAAGHRELNVDKLPESSRNWINEKLIYTHGYGVTMNPVNGFYRGRPADTGLEQHADPEHYS